MNTNKEMIKIVAKRLGFLNDKVAFLGGSTVSFLITDQAAPEVRATKDVDVIIDIGSRSEYYELEVALTKLGFIKVYDEKTPFCRWSIENILIDVMPTTPDILGFANRWYSAAITEAISLRIDRNISIHLVTAPYFLATKIEAFYGRGANDYLASQDIEDIIAVIDGRKELIAEIKVSPPDVQEFLSNEFQKWLATDDFLNALPGHLPPDRASQARASFVLLRMKEIVVRNTNCI